jgi:hypothetical protein
MLEFIFLLRAVGGGRSGAGVGGVWAAGGSWRKVHPPKINQIRRGGLTFSAEGGFATAVSIASQTYLPKYSGFLGNFS